MAAKETSTDRMQLQNKRCEPCQAGEERLKGPALRALLRWLDEGWQIIDDLRLEREFTFKDFREALAFVNRVGRLAEEEGHHPEMILNWGKVRVRLWTHKIDGLHENDFILAAKIDRLPRP
jgi:4a-hydroxytetrahydrobiopterin dehydratase